MTTSLRDRIAATAASFKPVPAALAVAGLAILAAPRAGSAADLPSTASPIVAPPPFFLFSDTVLEYRFESQATEPGAAIKFPKQIANVTHVDAFQYGTNFLSVDVLQSTSADPTAPVFQNLGPPYILNGQGSREVYALYRGTISGNAVTHSKTFAYGGIIKDVSFEYGGDLEAHNNEFGAEKSAIVFGPNIAFDVPGVLNLGIHVYKEWNHNGLTQIGGPLAALASPYGNFNPVSGRVSFDTTAEFEAVYIFPLTFTHMPLTFSGFANVILPKGLNGQGQRTRTELLTTQRLTLDAGSYFGHPKIVDVFVGYKFWYDKFGNNAHFGDTTYLPGSYENQFICGLDYHLQ